LYCASRPPLFYGALVTLLLLARIAFWALDRPDAKIGTIIGSGGSGAFNAVRGLAINA
jgi:hypothetical protein